MNKKFTFIDLFAGIGGFHIAMDNLGGECVFASEWDEDCRKTYTENFKNSSKYIFTDGKPNNNFSKHNVIWKRSFITNDYSWVKLYYSFK